MNFGPLVSAAWLREHLHDPDVRVIDFRWYLAGRAHSGVPANSRPSLRVRGVKRALPAVREGVDEYAAGHIPGAVFVDLEAVTGEQDSNARGRHPLPSAAQFESEMRKAGVDEDTRVVVYDDAGGSIAARLWFLLGWFGHHAQAVLDGGLQAWGGPLETSVTTPAVGSFRSREPDRTRIVGFDDVRRLDRVPVLDARAGERYRGEKEPVDPKAGHIPGALSAPWMDNLGADGRFKSPAELRERFAALGADEGAVVYCGSGVNATHHLLAMDVAGLRNARLYAGSWSDWSHRDAPVATGTDPG